MTRLYSNNASTTLATSITSSGQTSIVVTDASSFPIPTSPDYFTVTITNSGATETVWEEVKVTSVSGNTFTVTRGWEGTTAQSSWSVGSKVEIRWTAQAAQDSANISTTGSAVVDFGAAPGTNFITTTISGQTDIKSTSLVEAWIMYSSSTNHNAYDHIIAPITLRCGNIVPGTSFDIVAFSDQRLTGQFNVKWTRTK